MKNPVDSAPLTTEEMLQWSRDHWSMLKKEKRLEAIIEKIKKKDDFLNTIATEDIIAIEELFPVFLK